VPLAYGQYREVLNSVTGIANAVGGSNGTAVAKSFITIATRCDKQSPSSAPTAAPSTTAPAPTQTPSATATVPSATPSATASPLTPWTAAQRNQLAAAYDADPALASTSLACLQAVIPEQMPASEALQYISVAWVGPAPPRPRSNKASSPSTAPPKVLPTSPPGPPPASPAAPAADT